MYLAGVSVRRVEDITEALWGSRVSSSTISELNRKIYKNRDEWRNKPLETAYPSMFVDGIWLKRSWGGVVQSVSVLGAIGVNQEGYREIPRVAEGNREDAESWRNFFRYLKQRGPEHVRLIVSDKAPGVLEAIGDFSRKAAGSAVLYIFTGMCSVRCLRANRGKWAVKSGHKFMLPRSVFPANTSWQTPLGKNSQVLPDTSGDCKIFQYIL